MTTAIPVGTTVWFLRSEHDPHCHVATVQQRYPAPNGGHYYIIDCPSFTFNVGLALEHELFLSAPATAQASEKVDFSRVAVYPEPRPPRERAKNVRFKMTHHKPDE